MATVRIATRQSALALWQAEHVASLLRAAHPGLEVELVKMLTSGDRFLSAPLATIGGKGLFTKELEAALLAGEADLAVHSLKDVPAVIADGLTLASPPAREDPRDALCGVRLAALPPKARVGTSSLRRAAQLRLLRPDLRIEFIRGNVATRLSKLDGDAPLDGVVLAAAGLRRLGLIERAAELFPVETMVPAVGQGILGLERRTDAPRVAALLAPLAHGATSVCAQAERALLASLGAGCTVPLGGHATLAGDLLHLSAVLFDPAIDARHAVDGTAPAADAEALGRRLGAALLAGPARGVLAVS